MAKRLRGLVPSLEELFYAERVGGAFFMQKGKDLTESTSVLKHDSCSLILVIYILCYILGRVFFFMLFCVNVVCR